MQSLNNKQKPHCHYYGFVCYGNFIIPHIPHNINTLRPRQNGRYFADDPFKRIFFFYKTVRISLNISLKFIPKVPINNISALVQIMAWLQPDDKPLFEPMMVSLLTQICVTLLQWVKVIFNKYSIGLV